MKHIAILGSTGSIGTSTLDVVSRHPDRFEVFALAAARSHEEMLAQCMKHRPRYAVLADREAARALRTAVKREGLRTEVLEGAQALAEVAAHPDVTTVMAAIVGPRDCPPHSPRPTPARTCFSPTRKRS
jgi:1-deoxy-D-xylulose 5-phosphate reductoisomerase